MADHTLLHGVQAALDRRLRNRALDLQAQGMQMQDEDRDTRERDMQRRIIDQHNLNSAKLAANANKPDPNAWRMPVEKERTDRAVKVQGLRGDQSEYGWDARSQMNDDDNATKVDISGKEIGSREKIASEGNASKEKQINNTNWSRQKIAEGDRKSKELISDRADQTRRAVADVVARARAHLTGGGGSHADQKKLLVDAIKVHSDLLKSDETTPENIEIVQSVINDLNAKLKSNPPATRPPK